MKHDYLTTLASVLTIGALLGAITLFPTQFEVGLELAKSQVIGNFGFLFTYPAFAASLFFLVAAVTPLGRLRFGEGPPEFSTPSWMGMLFSTGMGIALLTWGVSEPRYHVEAGMSSHEALLTAFNHWGLLAWVGYLGVGVMFAHALYNLNITKPAERLLGNGFLSRLNLVSLVVATVIGLSLTFSYASTPLRQALADGLGLEVSNAAMILTLTAFAILSSVSGLQRGIKWLSNYNSVFALTLMLAVFVLTFPAEILKQFGLLLPEYLVRYPAMATDIGLGDPERKAWLADWLYAFEASWYGWFIFTGVFIARISKGRTLRELVLGILIVPTLLTCFWFVTFGLAGLEADVEDVFQLVRGLDTSGILSLVLLLNILLFFVTSADSAGLVCEMLTAKRTRIFWILAMATLAIVIGWLGGDVYRVILTLISVTAIPVAIGIFALTFGFLRRVLPRRAAGLEQSPD
ncbi:BCCT family transporter [Billgrantia lactosivorans]|uniref:BCCT family transporter n=1 Tax=Billgrantia lactosivorans TaxID=2185141 RepID=UPI000DAD3DD2|nr:BCCT family transporter [Halomonas lactosivorans]